MSTRRIEFRQVSFGYYREVPVLQDLDLVIDPGLTLLLGPNGGGKSTLLKIAAGVEQPDSGRVSVSGHDLWTDEVPARRDLAYLPEEPDLTPYASVLEILRLVCRLRGEATGRADEALSAAGLEGMGGRSVRQLSKGQRRRALLAAAWIGSPRTLLLDEPLDAMDQSMRQHLLSWLEKVRAEERAGAGGEPRGGPPGRAGRPGGRRPAGASASIRRLAVRGLGTHPLPGRSGPGGSRVAPR